MNPSSQSMLNLFHFTKEQDAGYSLAQDLWLAHKVKKHLQNGADIHARTPESPSYPGKQFNSFQVIHYAAYYGFSHVYQMAKNAGADLEAKAGFLEETPFQMIARRINARYQLFHSQKAYEKLAFKMIEDGAMTDIADAAGYTPLIRTESVQLTQKLIEMNANVNVCLEDGRNALHIVVSTYKAFENPSPDLIERYAFLQEQAFLKAQALINGGINMRQKNQYGQTPFDVIQDDYWHDYSDSKMYQLLEKATKHPSKVISQNPPKRAARSRLLDWQRD